jgi:GntR family transcriptional regulator
MPQNRASAAEPLEPQPFELDRGSHIPLYLQIKQFLSRQIAQWDRREERFYSDDELADMFKVSRMTVRQAVQALVNDGLLARAQGIGTFVVARRMAKPLAAPSAAREPEAALEFEVLIVEMQPCPPSFAAELGVAPETPVHYVFRLRKSGGVVVGVDHRYIPLSVVPTLSKAEAGRRGFWGRFRVSHTEVRLEATSASHQEARWLNLPVGAPLMLRRMRAIAEDGLVIATGYTSYRADCVHYAVRIPVSREMLEKAGMGEGQDRLVHFRREIDTAGPPAPR